MKGDEPSRATLGLVVKLLYDVDPWRPDWLAGDIERLREIRLRMLGAAN